jgi:DNA-binding MarR family transcriptional regulator
MEQEKTVFMIENEQSAKHMDMLFSFFRQKEQISFYGAKTYFSSTEICLIGEILSAKHQGKRLISTRLADILGITRSAVSQMVNKLEAEGVVKRVPDDVDRKIAYIEVTEKAQEKYGTDLLLCAQFVDTIVRKFGENKFEKMCTLFGDFFKLLQEEKAKISK